MRKVGNGRKKKVWQMREGESHRERWVLQAERGKERERYRVEVQTWSICSQLGSETDFLFTFSASVKHIASYLLSITLVWSCANTHTHSHISTHKTGMGLHAQTPLPAYKSSVYTHTHTLIRNFCKKQKNILENTLIRHTPFIPTSWRHKYIIKILEVWK